jgi:probable rRNA maturation factor
MPNCSLTLDIDNRSTCDDVPSEEEMRRWLLSFLDKHRTESIIALSLVSATEIQQLNQTYRKKNKPTNVLSFPAELPPGISYALLGDIIICPSVLADEAVAQGKPLIAHWAHLLIHGTLHLLGYDHTEKDEATIMESYEIEILHGLGFANPYGETSDE